MIFVYSPGQRDKPFVPDEEIHFRTPRPDLLDRPYAFDYLGESFRSHYKQSGSENNQIVDKEEKFNEKLAVSGTRWRLPLPTTSTSTTTIPPTSQKFKDRKPIARVSQIPLSGFEVRTTSNPRQRHPNRRLGNEVQSNSIDDDLSIGLSSYYNSSSDFLKGGKMSSNKIRIPSRTYEPPPVFPVYNKDYRPTGPTSTTAPFSASGPPTSKTTTFEPIKITPNAGKPFTPSGFGKATNFKGSSDFARSTEFTRSTEFSRSSDFSKTKAPVTFGRTPTPSGFGRTLTPQKTTPQSRTPSRKPVSRQLNAFNTNPTKSTKPTRKSVKFNEILVDLPTSNAKAVPSPFQINVPSFSEPDKVLLPPYETQPEHDIATTQGPPIYFEWKIPSNGLEPPKLEPPIGVNGRNSPEPFSLNSINSDLASSTTIKSSRIVPAPTGTKSQRSAKPTTTSTTTTTTQRSPTPRSIKDSSNEIHFSHNPATDEEFLKLRKDLSVPEFIFPLEISGRTGYEHLNTLNSFQLEIPKGKVDKGEIETRKTWFGENPKCPECHPTFLKPGTCEPCIKSR